ncbi:MAG: ROK family protein [Chlorobi bacterium]|nr:ROK family protein [Chlorobiota bacterium]
MMKMNVIGLDIGGTIIKIGIIRSGEIIAETTIDAISGKGLKGRLPAIEQAVNALLGEQNIPKRDLSGIGISSPGIIDPYKARLITVYNKFEDAAQLDLRAWAKEKWGIPLSMNNDARSACIGEWQYGAGKGCDNMVMVTLGTGFGSSAIIEGRILHGKHFRGGILGGHIIANAEGFQCNCGNIGCVEAHSSTWNLEAIAKNIDGFENSGLAHKLPLDFRIIFEEAAAGNKIAIKIRNYCMDYWAVGIANLIYAYDPERVVIGGGVMKSADVIIPYIQKKLKGFGWIDFDEIDIVKAKYPNSAALLSAEYLINNPV